MIETILLSSLIYLLVTLFPLSLGHCLFGKIVPGSAGLKISLEFCLGVFSLCLLTTVLTLSGLEHASIRILLILLMGLSFFLSFSGDRFLADCRKGHLAGYLLGLLSTLIFSLYLCFPNGLVGEALVDTSMMITGLPVDLIIPYNFSRIMLEGIDPNSVDIVPGWGAGDRGPIAAILNSAVFYMAGLKESANWMGSSQGLFFLYQTLVIALNSLGLVVVWFFTYERYGSRAAAYASVALLSCYFVALNMMFAWPKFFMAAILIASLWLWFEHKRWFLSGLIAGLAMLSHDSAIFTIAAFGAFAFALKVYEVLKIKNVPLFGAIRDLAIYPIGFCFALSPWLIAKAVFFKSSPRLLYMHLFCYTDENLEGVTLSSLARDYFQENGLLGALKIRLDNMVYPFDYRPVFEAVSESGSGLYSFIGYISPYQFLQAGVSFGPFLLLLFVLSIFQQWQGRDLQLLMLNLVAFLSLFFVSLISGCSGNTVSHIWAYPAFLTFAIALGSLLKDGNGIIQLLFSLGVGINGAIAYIYLFYRSGTKPFLHGSYQWYAGLIGLAVLILILLVWGAVDENKFTNVGTCKKNRD